MGGKSTYLRQSALIVLMAQMVLLFPARQAKLPVTTHLHAHRARAQSCARAASTFLVEMSEVGRHPESRHSGVSCFSMSRPRHAHSMVFHRLAVVDFQKHTPRAHPI